MTRDLAVLALMWIGWCALHSAMITRAVTERLKRARPGAFRFYRLFFNAVSLLTLAPVAACELSIAGQPMFKWQGVWEIPRFVLLAAAVVLGLAGAARYDLLSFAGIRQAFDPRRAAGAETLGVGGAIDKGGIHRFIRHPWYLAGIAVVWTRDLTAAALVSNSAIAVYLLLGTLLEERKLVSEFGEEYRSYRRETSMFLPLNYIASRIRGIR